MIQDLTVMAITLLLSAFFSGVEIAFFTANKFKIELRNSQGDWVGRILSGYLKNIPRFIATTLIGVNFALVIFGMSASRVFEALFLQYLGWNPDVDTNKVLFFQTLFTTLIILLFGEYIPKVVFRRNSDGFLAGLALPMEACFRLLKPFVLFAEFITQQIFKYILKAPMTGTQVAFSKHDLQNYILETLADNEDSELDPQVFSNALDFNKVRVKEFMIPRTEIVALPISASMSELHARFVETEISRIVIYNRSLDDVKGFVHSQALFRKPEKIQDVIQSIPVVPESMPANNLLREFHQKRKRIAIVVDEFGGTSGLVTLEDLVETVFGDIDDEYDSDSDEDHLIEQKISENAFLFSARIEVEYANETYGLELPEGDYSTLGGMIMAYAERILLSGETLEIEGYKITVTQSRENKIDAVRIDRSVRSKNERGG